MKALATGTVEVEYEGIQYLAYYEANNSVEFIITKVADRRTGQETTVDKISADFYNLIDSTITKLRGKAMEKRTEFPQLQLGDTVKFGQYKGNTVLEIATDGAVKPPTQGDFRKRDNTKSWISYLEEKQISEGKAPMFHPVVLPFVGAWQKLKKVAPNELNRVLTKMAQDLVAVANSIPDDEPAPVDVRERDAF